MKKPGTQSFWTAVMIVCFLPVLLAAHEWPSDVPPPPTVSSLNEVIIIDRLIADRAYVNIKAGRSADYGLDFVLLDQAMEKYRPELEKFDPIYYGALRETYERMKAYVTNPNSDFVRAVQKPGSVEFPGRSPLPAAAFADQALQARNAALPGKATHEVQRRDGRGIDELEPFLPDKAKETLSNIRRMPETTDSARKAKLRTIEQVIAAWEKNSDRLETTVMIEILQGMQTGLQPASAPRIDSDVLPEGITPEMFDQMSNPTGPTLPQPKAEEFMKTTENQQQQLHK